MTERKDERLRQAPDERFAGAQHFFDLAGEAAKLEKEVEAGEQGHRQVTLYKHGLTTVALFLFGHRTRLPAHRTKGVVLIQVLRGHLRVTAAGEAHDLRKGALLVLAPDVEHDVAAVEVSAMLLTVNRI